MVNPGPGGDYLDQTLPELESVWPLDGVADAAGTDLSRYFLQHPHVDFCGYSAGGARTLPERWGNAVLHGFGVVRNADTVVVAPPLAPPGSLEVAAHLIEPIGRRLQRRDHRKDRELAGVPARTRCDDRTGATAALSGAGDLGELATLLAESVAQPHNPDARIVMLGADRDSRTLARGMVAAGVDMGRISFVAQAGARGAVRNAHVARRGFTVAPFGELSARRPGRKPPGLNT